MTAFSSCKLDQLEALQFFVCFLSEYHTTVVTIPIPDLRELKLNTFQLIWIILMLSTHATF